MARRKLKLSLFDAVVCLALAARLHSDPMEVKRTAKRVMPLLARHERGALAPIIATQQPHALIWQTLKELDSDQTPLPSTDRPGDTRHVA